MANSMYVVYYIKQVPAIDEVQPYQGKIVRAVGAIPGYEPTQEDIQEYSPPEEVDVALGIQICLN